MFHLSKHFLSLWRPYILKSELRTLICDSLLRTYVLIWLESEGQSSCFQAIGNICPYSWVVRVNVCVGLLSVRPLLQLPESWAFLMLSIITINLVNCFFSFNKRAISSWWNIWAWSTFHNSLFATVSPLKVLDWCDTKLTTAMNFPSRVSLASQIFAANK